MTSWTVGEPVFTINSHNTAAHPGVVVEVTDVDIVVESTKGEQHYFDIDDLYAKGDYWEPGESRPRIAKADDPTAVKLDNLRRHKLKGTEAQRLVHTFQREPNTVNFLNLTEFVREWGNWVVDNNVT